MFTIKNVSIMFFIIFSFSIVSFDLWNYIEPFMGMLSLGISVGVYLQTRKAKFAVADNGDGINVITLQAGRDITNVVKAQAGQIDHVICSRIIYGSGSVTTAQQIEMAKMAYKQICAYPNRKFKIYLSTPIGVGYALGQMLGVYKQNVVFYQYDTLTGKYEPLPNITPDDL